MPRYWVAARRGGRACRHLRAGTRRSGAARMIAVARPDWNRASTASRTSAATTIPVPGCCPFGGRAASRSRIGLPRGAMRVCASSRWSSRETSASSAITPGATRRSWSRAHCAILCWRDSRRSGRSRTGGLGISRAWFPKGTWKHCRPAANCMFFDRRLAEYRDRLAYVVSGPLFDLDRLVEIWRLNTGAYDHLIDQERGTGKRRLWCAAIRRPACAAAGEEPTYFGINGIDIDVEERAPRAPGNSASTTTTFTRSFSCAATRSWPGACGSASPFSGRGLTAPPRGYSLHCMRGGCDRIRGVISVPFMDDGQSQHGPRSFPGLVADASRHSAPSFWHPLLHAGLAPASDPYCVIRLPFIMGQCGNGLLLPESLRWRPKLWAAS